MVFDVQSKVVDDWRADEQTGDAPLHGAETQHLNQPDQAPSQVEIRLTSTAMHANPLAVHHLQFGLDRKDKDLDVGQDVPAVPSARTGNATGRRGRQVSRAQEINARHPPNMVSGADAPLYVSGPT
jgi:hypothetical protein